jgi:fructosamine-3-kinase
MQLPPKTFTQLTELLRETFGSHVELERYQIVNHHPDYYVLLVTLHHPSLELSVKLAGREAPYSYPFERTAAFHRLVSANTTIPMPEIIAVDVSYRAYPWRYLIKTYIPGEEWAAIRSRLNHAEQVDAYRQIGNAVAQLHSIVFDGFGNLDVSSSSSTGNAYFPALIGRVCEIIHEENLRELFLALLEANRGLFSNVTQARLCHEDLHQHNILFRQGEGQWQLATILDFDKAWAGHHEIDLAKLELWTGTTGDGFWEAYNSILSTDPDYPQRRPIYQLLWCLEYAANTPQHISDTQRLCKALNFPMIERF